MRFFCTARSAIVAVRPPASSATIPFTEKVALFYEPSVEKKEATTAAPSREQENEEDRERQRERGSSTWKQGESAAQRHTELVSGYVIDRDNVVLAGAAAPTPPLETTSE